jgi:alpha-galactosidase
MLIVRRAAALALFVVLVAAPAASAQAAGGMKPLPPGPDGTIRFGECHARLENGRLTIGNNHVQRIWALDATGALTAVSFRDLSDSAERIAPVTPEPRRAPRAVRVDLAAAGGQAGPTEEPSLLVTLTAALPRVTVTTRFQVFAASRGILMDRKVTVTGPVADAGAIEALNRMEAFTPAARGFQLTRVIFLDQTDRQPGPLVIETPCSESDPELVAGTNPGPARCRGNVFIVEDPATTAGLLFLEHAPLPDMRPSAQAHPQRPAADLTRSLDPSTPNAVQFAGDEITAAGGATYRWITIAYAGGRAGRIAALQQHHRQLRRYESGRDGLLLTNTWGDRSQDGRVSEAFMTAEIAAAARLGADVVEIDDGWQKGATENSVNKGGVWNGFYAKDANFWSAHPVRFPNGIKPLADLAAGKGMQFGLWFAPDSSGDFANWEKDRDLVLGMHRERGVNYFKFDGIKVHTAAGEANVHRLVASIIEGSAGKVTIDLDATAEVRPGYFGMPSHGPIFVENRYSDSGTPTPELGTRGYWPHKTLRNFWLLAQYVDPVRLRMEFLNNARNAAKYGGNPLAPSMYSPDYLFATVMFASPLGWFETQNLPAEYFDKVAPLVQVRKAHRDAIFAGSIVPVGEVPGGASWTGFVSVAPDRRSAYVLVFRELTERPSFDFDLPLVAHGDYDVKVLAGSGRAVMEGGTLRVSVPEPRRFLLVQLSPRGTSRLPRSGM